MKILFFMIISLSPLIVNGRSTLESSIVRPLVPVAQTLSDQFVKQVDPYGIVVKVTQNQKLTEEDVYIVWFSKTLKNWKALVSTNISDGMYYEITYNGDRRETYLDAYKKWENKCIPD